MTYPPPIFYHHLRQNHKDRYGNCNANKPRALRIEKKLTQNEMAEKIGLVGATISAYEKSRKYPSIEILIQLCQIFNVSADYLLGFSDNKEYDLSSLTDEQLQLVLRLIHEFEQFNELKEK